MSILGDAKKSFVIKVAKFNIKFLLRCIFTNYHRVIKFDEKLNIAQNFLLFSEKQLAQNHIPR